MMAETAQSQVVAARRRARSPSGPRAGPRVRVGPATETNHRHDDLCSWASAQLGLVGETGR